MNIKQKICSVLSKTGLPYAFVQKGEGTFPFIVYNVSEDGEDFGDDKEAATSFDITINIFSKGDFEDIKNLVIKDMLAEGFTKTSVPKCHFLEDVSVYNQPIFFNYYYEGE